MHTRSQDDTHKQVGHTGIFDAAVKVIMLTDTDIDTTLVGMTMARPCVVFAEEEPAVSGCTRPRCRC